MTQSSHKMSLCYTYRSFAIYIVIVSLISESPVSAFAVRRVRTTTLRPLDLSGEESALLEVKSELSKLNNERDNIKHRPEKLTIRKSVNYLAPDKKLASNSRKNVITTTLGPINNHDELTKPSDETSTRDIETTTGNEATRTNSSKKYRILNVVNDNESEVKSIASEIINPNKQADENTPKKIKVIQNGETIDKQKEMSQNETNLKTKINELGALITNSGTVESTTLVTEEIETTDEDMTISEYPVDDRSTTIINENEKSTSMRDIFTSDPTQAISSTPDQDETSEAEVSETTGIDKTETDATQQTESMESQSSKASTNNPLWKKYTVIERKRIISTTDSDTISTGELENAESVSSTVTLENDINVPQSQAIKDQQETTNSKPTTTEENEEDTKVPLTTYETTRVLEKDTKQVASTLSIEKDITTTDSVGSRRAGYLDYSVKQSSTKELPTTEYLENTPFFNETELLGSILEIETQEDGPDVKNSTIVESQSQLVDDAIKEELLKEEVMNDHAENSKRLEEQQDLDKVKPLDINDGTDDSLSVKPITSGKGALYSVSSNYKKMKKIEVQPSRPFVRDPDDNSWRNESLTSLGIVFKAKNASKPFTQVLKNKTEAELNNLVQPERDANNNEVPDLRQRLEKITEVRKSRKKKIDKYGDTIYSDYEEASGETPSTPRTNTVSIPIMEVEGELFFVPSTKSSPMAPGKHRTSTLGVYMYKEETSKKPKKPQKFSEYYDTTDEYDADYLNLAKIDLKKFTTRQFANDDHTSTTSTTTAAPVLTPFTMPAVNAPQPDRKPTVQYFPPRPQPQKVSVNDYDNDFQRKVNMFEQEKPPKATFPITQGTPQPATMIKETPLPYKHVLPQLSLYKPVNLDKNVYVTFPSQLAEHANRYPGGNDESFNRASYVIKHYRDLINEAAKDDYDKSGEFLPPFTEQPLLGVTMALPKDRLKHMDGEYDYDANFRRDLLSRFVDNFNQNSERFKVDFPILYNNTVVHMKAEENGKVVASSSAFMKRLYGEGGAGGAGAAPRACEPHCELKVELSPAYELTYYVPDQEEKEVAELKPPAPSFSYRL